MTRLAMSECLLRPFRELVQRASRVRIQSLGHLNSVDFHALENAESVLLASRPVVYGLDLANKTRPDGGAILRALVVADTRGDLAAARQEARAVEHLLRERGVEQIRVLQGDEADLATIKNALRNADLFHYAGHANYSGHGGWDSVLQLADGTEFGVGDILTLDRVPHTIVLSGCETAMAAQADAPESLGLAQAFLAMGANMVVAATRPVEDAVALDVVSGVYRNWTNQVPLEQALRLTQMRLRHTNDDDWAAYRLLMP